ncbi:hypothetical protein U14_00088 [Candidatus Moduliflexus flocculans]|uniref:Uncharacterized protein n=1 Tax=Candidatus Moduliflexus flocculans TaxID=1499966 RepID=A0A0S6VPA2_9BACT|nr:hypothetical protein U14_00088 [Candidatus Moduliflexus flocculans]
MRNFGEFLIRIRADDEDVGGTKALASCHRNTIEVGGEGDKETEVDSDLKIIPAIPLFPERVEGNMSRSFRQAQRAG